MGPRGREAAETRAARISQGNTPRANSCKVHILRMRHNAADDHWGAHVLVLHNYYKGVGRGLVALNCTREKNGEIRKGLDHVTHRYLITSCTVVTDRYAVAGCCVVADCAVTRDSEEEREKRRRGQLDYRLVHDRVSCGRYCGAVLLLVEGAGSRDLSELGGDKPGNRRRISPAADASRIQVAEMGGIFSDDLRDALARGRADLLGGHAPHPSPILGP